MNAGKLKSVAMPKNRPVSKTSSPTPSLFSIWRKVELRANITKKFESKAGDNFNKSNEE